MALYIVPTPIGNLKDITLRAIEILRRVDFIIAEDTRHSRKLLSHLGIHKRIVSHFKPRERLQAEAIVRQLKNRDAALISDSGTPLLSDPGLLLVQSAIAEGIPVVPLPGPTALMPALAASGIAPEPFLFLGFSPRKSGEREAFLRRLCKLPYTLVFYESPRRIGAFLETAAAVFGDRRFALAKEISKKNEKWIRGSLARAGDILAAEIIAGEMVLVIAGSVGGEAHEPAGVETIDDLYRLCQERLGIPRNRLKKVIYGHKNKKKR